MYLSLEVSASVTLIVFKLIHKKNRICGISCQCDKACVTIHNINQDTIMKLTTCHRTAFNHEQNPYRIETKKKQRHDM